MHTMFIWETPIIDSYISLARKSPTDPFIRFEDEWLESALGKMECRRQPGNPTTDNNGIVVFVHCDDYISEHQTSEVLETSEVLQPLDKNN